MKAVLSLGSNLGDSLAILGSAVGLIRSTPGVEDVRVSPLYVTAPVGGVDQDDFLNLVVVVSTELPATALLARAMAIEEVHGRRRTIPNGPRTLDIDLVDVGGQVVDEEDLVLPHPRAHERAFVLVPWHDIDPDAVLPGHGPVEELLAGFSDDDLAAAVRPSPRQLEGFEGSEETS